MTTATETGTVTDAVEMLWRDLPDDRWLTEAEIFAAICETRIGGWHRDDPRMLKAILEGWLVSGQWVTYRHAGEKQLGKIKDGPQAGRPVSVPVFLYRKVPATEISVLQDRAQAEKQHAEQLKAARAPLQAAVEAILAERAAATAA